MPVVQRKAEEGHTRDVTVRLSHVLMKTSWQDGTSGVLTYIPERQNNRVLCSKLYRKININLESFIRPNDAWLQS